MSRRSLLYSLTKPVTKIFPPTFFSFAFNANESMLHNYFPSKGHRLQSNYLHKPYFYMIHLLSDLSKYTNTKDLCVL